MKFIYRSHANAECQLGLSGWSLTSSPAHLFAKRGWLELLVRLYRSSRSEVFCKKGALGNFAKPTGKHLCQSLFFNKVTALRFATLLKKRVWRRCLPVNFWKNTFSYRTPPVAPPDFTQSWRYNTKLHKRNKREMENGYENPMIFCVSIFIFCLEPTVKEQLDENGFRHCYGIFSETTIPKLLDQAMFKVLSQQLPDTL